MCPPCDSRAKDWGRAEEGYPGMAKAFLIAALCAFLGMGAATALADEKKLLVIEPVSSDELSSEKGEGLGGQVQGAYDDALRRRGAEARTAVEGVQNIVTLNSRQTGQVNSTSLRAVNDAVGIRNLAGSD